MTSGRDRILGEVRAQLARCPEVTPDAVEPHHGPRSTDELSEPKLVAAFEARLKSVGGHVHHAADADAAARMVEQLADEHGADTLGVSDSTQLEAVRRTSSRQLLGPDSDRDALLACDVGVTSAQAGIAETGSLLLVSRDEQHRLISLLPPVHIAILPAGDITATLGDGFALARGDEDPPPAAITLITGPSRTADIELTLVVGVHGPKELHVILVADPAGT